MNPKQNLLDSLPVRIVMKSISLLLLLASAVNFGQKIKHLESFKDMGTESYLRLNYENDFFAATDKNYTQGYSFEFVDPLFEKNPIQFAFVKPKHTSNTFGITMEHIGFTPSDFVSPEIQMGDRPFAAALYLKSFTVSLDTVHKTRWSQSLSLGLIGPGAFGREMQTKIHALTGNKIPGGWDNQIQNDVVLNYGMHFEKQWFRYRDIVSLQSIASFQLGTLFTNASMGLNTTIGVLGSPFSLPGNPSKFKVFVYAQPMVTGVGYDATLQGGVFTTDNRYRIAANDLERVTAQLDFGLIVRCNNVYLEYARSTITKEFKTGSTADWGGFKIGIVL